MSKMSEDTTELSTSSAGDSSRSNVLLDHLPLLQRQNILLKAKPHKLPLHLTSDAVQTEGEEDVLSPPINALVQREDKHFDFENAHCTKKCSPEPTNTDSVSELLDYGKIKIEPSDETGMLSHQRSASRGLDAILNEQSGQFQDLDGWLDELDHVPLTRRKEMLLANKQLIHMYGNYSRTSQVYDRPSMLHQKFSIKEEEGHCDSQDVREDSMNRVTTNENEVIHSIPEISWTGNELYGPGKGYCSDTCGTLVNGISSTYIGLPCEDNHYSILPGYSGLKTAESPRVRLTMKAQTSEGTSSLKRKPAKLERCKGNDHVTLSEKSFPDSTLRSAVKIKIEPSDHSGMVDSRHEAVNILNFYSTSVKREEEFDNDIFEDKLDHMLLRKRMNLSTLPADSVSDHDGLSRALCASEEIPTVLEFVKPISIKRPWKRRKTVTDSVETALEEDAPGLLRVLLDKGVSVDEIKLYGDVEDDDPLDGFAELEDVISNVFSERQTFSKFGLIRSIKDAKTTYCLACLFSLVEQTRYLKFRKWPVEWGWCRDLQSFIFVFERHKRIVLERPEYGYATYFFELVDSLSIAWQVKRLVIAMKLTSCSRASLIENKALKVGEDLTEGEAKVLMEYGWRPNRGLGTMLNYCDRVVHDRKKDIEMETSEWRAKIGKLLIDGYNGGTIVSSSIEKKAIEYENPLGAEVKREEF